jgi:hypothetical protein
VKHRTIVPLFALVAATTGCVTVRPSAEYKSTLKVEQTPVRVSLAVIARENNSRTDSLRSTLRTSLARDLADNGPFAIAANDPDAALEIEITSADDVFVWGCGLLTAVAPIGCLVTPTESRVIRLSVKGALRDDQGRVVSEHVASAGVDSKSAWIYTGSQTDSYGEVARQVTEKLRWAFAADRGVWSARLLARRSERTRVGAVTPAPASQPGAVPPEASTRARWSAAAGAQKRVAVLDFRGVLDPSVLSVLGDRARGVALRTVGRAGYVVMTRESMAALLKDMGSSAICAEGECEVDTARNIGADLVVTGEVVKVGGQLIVTMKLHETARGALLETTDYRAGSELGLVDGIGPAAETLFK